MSSCESQFGSLRMCLWNSSLNMRSCESQLWSLLESYECVEIFVKLLKEEIYSKPMPWIGLYITVASLICTLAMVADLLHGFRSRKLWFPSKYFTLNAATLTIIAVAMKLPVDLTTPMPENIDQLVKHSSMALMSTMMANFLPSLATMENKELLLNMVALVILVITIAVNVIIQINTGVISEPYFLLAPLFLAFMLFLMLISVSLAVKAPTSKKILEWKYRELHEKDHQRGKITEESAVEKLTTDVRKYWIMAETGNPQFVMAASPGCSAAGAISLFTAFWLLIFVVVQIFINKNYDNYDSDYKWSVLPILGTQSIGVGLGSIAPIFRWFAALNFKLSVRWSKNQIKVFRVENYWFKLLRDWKQSPVALRKLGGGRRYKKLVHNLKKSVLNICIVSQVVIVVLCKIIRFIPICFVIFVVYSYHCGKLLKKKLTCAPPSTSYNAMGSESGQQQKKNDFSIYVLQLQDGEEPAKRTLKSISNAVDRLIKNAEKHRPKSLIDLLKKSKGLHGVTKLKDDQIPCLHPEQAPDCWSLAVVTLTSIAIALPCSKDKSSINCLLQSVSEGLFYVNPVEKTFNASGNVSRARKAAEQVWQEVELDKKWLGDSLQRMTQEGKTSKEILRWLGDKAKTIVTGFKGNVIGGPEEDSLHKFIAANSMYRISQAILLDDGGRNYNSIENEDLHERLKVMIAYIVSACLTNLPRVIIMKCYEGAIEKREQNVKAAAQLLGQTKEILKILEDLELPPLDPDQMPYLDEWRRALLKVQNPADPDLPSKSERTTLTIGVE